ncbi:MAG: hypothetical protein JWM84_87 [Nocardioides sp.]|nr:hypothetical protein [Nocardioides sp.]
MDDDDTLARLVAGSVADLEPAERLDEIRARTQRTGSRRGWYAAGGVALATAAAVTAFAVLAGDEPRTTAPDPARSPSQVIPSPETTAFFVGDTARGPRLFRDVVALPIPDPRKAERFQGASPLVLETTPADPDYRTLWPTDAFAGSSLDGDVIEVELADPALRERPGTMTEHEAELAVEQVIQTVRWQVESARAVRFSYDGNPMDQVFGVPTNEPLVGAPDTEVRSLMSIEYPSEEEIVSGAFVATGENNGTEATMNWRIEDATGAVVLDGFATAEGWGEDRLFPWETDPIDVSELAPGSYTFVATNPDVSDGEGFPPDTDTRTIIVE